MENEKVLELDFKDLGNKIRKFIIKSPKEDVTREEILTLANLVTTQDIFKGISGKLVSFEKAFIKEINIKPIA